MTYWKATVACSEISVTDVIAKSVSECARMRDLFNFRAIAKAITTLPKHDNIVKLIGTSLEDVPYFIYQEYIERGTLKDYMLRHCKTTTNDDSLELEVPDQEKNLQLTQFAVDICEGMFFLAQQNFRHPGLSARKVLLTPAGKCKLHDFCPVDVAVDSINQILQKKIPPTAWLAPETIFIGHYVEKSDVWSFGVVLWEIYSQGDSIDISIDSKPGDKVILNCTANGAATKEWKYEGYLIFHNLERFAQELNNTIYAEEEFQKLMNNSVHVDENNSLIINPVSTGHEGTYACWINKLKKEKILLQIKVPPDMILSINGKEYKTELVWLSKGNNVTITCRALNSIPAANITWSRQPFSSDQTTKEDCIVNDNGNTDTTSLDERFNSTSTIHYQPEQDEKLVCCAWFGAEVVGKFILKVSTYELVLQPVEVEVNGIAAMDTIPRKTMAMVTCAANITKLPYHDNLVWRVNSTSDFHSESKFTDAHQGSPTRSSVAVYSVTYLPPQEVREFIECTVTDETFGTTTTIWRSFQTFDVSLKPIGVQVNGIDITGRVFVTKTNDVHVTCTASITGISDYSRLVGRVSTTSNITSSLNLTNSNVTLTTKNIVSSTLSGESFSAIYSPSEEKGYIACTVNDTMFGTTTTIRRSFETFDFVDVTLYINEMEDNRSIYIIREQGTYYATCSFLLQKVPINITWKVINTTVPKVTSGESSSILIFSPTKRTGSVACVLEGPYNQIFYQTISFEVSEFTEGPGSMFANIYFLASFGAAFAAAVILLGCVLVCWKKGILRPQYTIPTRSTHLMMVTRRLPPINLNRIESTALEQMVGRVVQHDEEERSFLRPDDVKLSFQLPSNGTMNYWIATISSDDISATKVVAKTVSGSARMKELHNFKEIAKAIIILSKHDNIVEVLGISLETVPYFIYQEYVECGTLKAFLTRNYESSGNAISHEEEISDQNINLQLTAFAVDICKGMLFLSEENYRHPALSSRKILISATGVCKLYDFCPVHVAMDTVSQILEKEVPPTAWLAPETIFIGHYLDKSDIWSFGVVMWEMYSLGKTPYDGLTCFEIESKLRRKQYCEQPSICPGGIYDTMLLIWNPTTDKRPSFARLQTSLLAFLNDMRKSNDDDGDDEIDSDEPVYSCVINDTSENIYIDYPMG
ncbi:uncharacterized protein [Apostichopus japonicus]|uniref:uncharacterized protein isoform X2 n=1 Tax=Stichopus japonicus TaxID=307972 RepID=UPI003AB1A474